MTTETSYKSSLLRAAVVAALATLLLLAGCQTTTDDNREDEGEADQLGTLEVSITGLPQGALAAVTVTGPNAFERQLTASTVLTDLEPARYDVIADAVEHGGSSYVASVNFSPIEVEAGRNGVATVRYATDELLAEEDGDSWVAPAVLARFTPTASQQPWLSEPLFNTTALLVRGLSYRNDLSNPGDRFDFVEFEIATSDAPTATLKAELDCGVYAANPSPIRAEVWNPSGDLVRSFNCNSGEVVVTMPNTGGTLRDYRVQISHLDPAVEYYVAYELNLNAFCFPGCNYQPYTP